MHFSVCNIKSALLITSGATFWLKADQISIVKTGVARTFVLTIPYSYCRT